MRRASEKEEPVVYSRTRRAGRSQRLQIIARPSDTSPLATPQGICGRVESDVTTAGACPITGTARWLAIPANEPSPRRTNVRRSIGNLLGGRSQRKIEYRIAYGYGLWPIGLACAYGLWLAFWPQSR